MFDTDKDTRPDPGEDNQPDSASAEPDAGAEAQATNPPPEGDEAAASTPPETAAEDDDVDAIELREAQAAVEAEKADGEGASEGEPGTDAAAADGQQEKPGEGKEGEGGDKSQSKPTDAEPPMIPKARFDEVLQQNQELARQHAYLQGQLEASRAVQQKLGEGEAGAQPGQTQPAPQQTDPATQITTIRTQINGLAEKFDNGEISAAEWKAQEADLQDQIAEIREAQLLAKVKPEQSSEPLPSLADQHFVQTRTEELNREHPFVDLVSDDDFGFIRDRALHSLGDTWQAMPAGPAKDMALREKVAELSDEYGPKLTGMTLDQAKAKAAGAQPAGQTAEKPASASAQDRKTKLDMAGTMPPDVSQMTGSPGQEMPSGAQLETMSDEDIVNNLPASTRQKMMETGRI